MIEFGHSIRGARHYDLTMPGIARSLDSISKSLEILSKKVEDEITLKALHKALDEHGRSMTLAEVIDDMERKQE